ncbi:MAG: NADAR domain-containing protein [Flammeovirgaceae bacterium]
MKVMQGCLRDKFQQEPYKSLLINTGDLYIQEGNRWGDKFWGVDLRTGKGLNTLGKLIMEIREELKEET